MSANKFDALVDMPDDVPKIGKSRKAKKHHCAPLPQSSRLDRPGSLSSADNISLASAEQDTRKADFRQVGYIMAWHRIASLFTDGFQAMFFVP